MLCLSSGKIHCCVLLSCWICLLGLGESISISKQVAVIAALKEHFRIGCIFLLNTGKKDFHYEANMVKELKLLSTQQVLVVSLVKLEEARCHRNRAMFIMTAEYDTASAVMQQFSSSVDVSASVWLLFLYSNFELDELFSGINIPFNCEFLVAEKSNDDIHLTEVYRIIPSQSLKKQYFGVWSSSRGLTAPAEKLSLKRTDLQGITIRVGVMDDPYTAVIEEKDGKPIRLNGFSYEVWKVLEERFNFRTKYVKPPDEKYGSKDDDGAWNGLVGMIFRNETDVSITPLIWDKQRDQVVDFIASMFKISLVLTLKELDSSELIWNKFLLPFSTGLWMSILATIAGSALLLFVIDKVWSKFLRRHSWDKNISFLSEAFLLTFGAFCYQGYSSTPKFTSSRIIFVSTYLTSVVVLCCYSGSLISHITTQQYKLPFDSLQGFLKDGTYKMGVLKSSGDLTYFKESNDSMIHKIYRDFIAPYRPSSLFSSYIEGLERVCSQHKFASVFGDDKFTSLSSLNCNIHYLPIVQYDMSMTMRKNSPFKPMLSYALHQMYRSGIIKILLRLHTPMQNIKVKNEFNPVSFIQIMPICMVLALGASLAIIIILIERLLYSCSSSTQYPVKKISYSKYLKEVHYKHYIWNQNIKSNAT